jgi:hypothetical protein
MYISTGGREVSVSFVSVRKFSAPRGSQGLLLACLSSTSLIHARDAHKRTPVHLANAAIPLGRSLWRQLKAAPGLTSEGARAMWGLLERLRGNTPQKRFLVRRVELDGPSTSVDSRVEGCLFVSWRICEWVRDVCQ